MNPPRWLATAAWGLFCTNSWTWCIGMYLPVILLRRFGWPGFLAFVIPNVLGCAALGYVLRHKRSSVQLVEQHRTAMRWFSLVAIAFQMFFIPFFAAWFMLPLPDIVGESLTDWFSLILAVAVLAAAVIVSLLPTKLWPVLAVATYGLSLTAFGQWGTDRLRDIAWTGSNELNEVLWLSPIFVFGFVLCPYLDLTFHRARQDSPSRHTFAVFGLTFAVLIVFTGAYAFDRSLTPLLMWYVLAQSVFTIAAHIRELRRQPGRGGHRKWLGMVAVPLAVAVLSYAITTSGDGNRAGETMYLRFLVFYGLVFPAYVLLFVGPGKTLSLSRKNITVYALTVLVSLPLFELGFIHGRPWLLVIPLAGLLVLKSVAR